jgi:ubiquinone/menaquinone biosynthesis C-methylase UbiE
MGWGAFHIPERTLRILGEVRGKDVLELGCGAARWSVALARAGARVVGLDVSPRRLEQARRTMRAGHVEFPLLEASAESVPLPDASMDVVFCDHGAMSFCDPYRTVPEVARILRPGGFLAFCAVSPFRYVCQDRRADKIDRVLRHEYFGLHRLEIHQSVEFTLPYGLWVRLFDRYGLRIERLEELRPAARSRSTFLRTAEIRWARRWPMEMLWKVRKERRRGALGG